MQLPNDSTLKLSVESQDQEIHVELLFDWDRDGSFAHEYSDLSAMVVQADMDKSLTGALPVDAPVIEGVSATELNLTLSGDRGDDLTTSAAELFSPYQPRSPLYGKAVKGTPVRYSIVIRSAEAHFSSTVRQFTGKIREAKVTASTGEVSLTCIDAVQDLQRLISIPPFANSQSPTHIHQQVNSSWMLDRVLRANGFYSSPPNHPDACFSATLAGSFVPEIGLVNIGAAPVWITNGGWAGPEVDPWAVVNGTVALRHDAWLESWYLTAANNIPRPDVGRTIGVAAQFQRPWVAGANQNASVMQCLNGKIENVTVPNFGTDRTAWIELAMTQTGTVAIRTYNNFNGRNESKELISAYLVPGGSSTSPFVGVQGEAKFLADGVKLSVKVGNNPWESKTIPGSFGEYVPPTEFPGFPFIEWPLSARVLTGWQTIKNAQTYATFLEQHTVFKSDFVPTAKLDMGLNRLAFIPDLRSVNSWETLKEIVEAEFGSLFVDEHGVVTFWNRRTTRDAKLTRDRVFTASQVSDLTLSDLTDVIRNDFTGVTTLKEMEYGSAWTAASAAYVVDSRVTPPARRTPTEMNWYKINPGFIRFGAEVRNFIYPSLLGRNCIGYVSPADFKYYEDGRWFRNCSAVIASTGAIPPNTGHNPRGGGPMTVDIWLASQGTLTLDLFNFHNETIQMSTGLINSATVEQTAGSTRDRYALEVPGWLLADRDGVPYRTFDQTSIDTYGHRPYEISESVWRQLPAQMTYIADLLKNEMGFAVPLIEDIETSADPRIQLGDTIEIQEAGAVGDTLIAIVSGVKRSIGPGGFTDTYSLKLTHRPSSWILGDKTYGVLGSTTILTTPWS